MTRRSKEQAVYARMFVDAKDGKFVSRIAQEAVRVMARAEGYAMVRRKGCAPFVVSEKELESRLLSRADGERQE